MPAVAREVEAFFRFARLPEASLVLDFGCGRGLWSCAASRRGHTVVALDVAESTVASLGPADLNAGPGRILPVAGTSDTFGHAAFGRFDAIVCIDVLHHVEDINATIEALLALLRPGGVFACLEPNARFPFWRLMPWVIQDFDWAFEHGVVRCREEYLVDALRVAGGHDVCVTHWKLLPGNLTERLPFLKRIEDMALKLLPLRNRSFFLMLRCVA